MMEICPFTALIHAWPLRLPAVVDWAGQSWRWQCCLPGVSLAEAEQFVDILYGRENILSISNEHYTVIEDSGITDEFVSNNNCDNKYVKLDPIWLMKYVVTSYCLALYKNLEAVVMDFYANK